MKYSNPSILSTGEGKKIIVGTSTLYMKLFSEVVSNRFSITEYELASGFPGPPAHKHNEFEHAWYVLEGNLTVQLANEISILTKGSFIFIPKKTVHAFANNTDSTVKLLVIDTPGGFENYYDDLQAAFGSGEQIDQETMKKIQIKYDTFPPDHIFE